MTPAGRRADGSRPGGPLYGIGAYGSSGMFPAFFPLLKPAGAMEVLAHRRPPRW